MNPYVGGAIGGTLGALLGWSTVRYGLGLRNPKAQFIGAGVGGVGGAGVGALLSDEPETATRKTESPQNLREQLKSRVEELKKKKEGDTSVEAVANEYAEKKKLLDTGLSKTDVAISGAKAVGVGALVHSLLTGEEVVKSGGKKGARIKLPPVATKTDKALQAINLRAHAAALRKGVGETMVGKWRKNVKAGLKPGTWGSSAAFWLPAIGSVGYDAYNRHAALQEANDFVKAVEQGIK